MKYYFVFQVLIASICFTGCSTMAPVSNSFESAKTLNKNQVELMGNYSFAFISEDDEIDQTNNNLGFRIGYGITDKFEAKFRYERLMPVTQWDKEILDGINYFSLTPRYSIIENKFTGGVGVGFYNHKTKETESTTVMNVTDVAISPNLAFTFLADTNFDMTLSTKFDFYTDGNEVYWHINLGSGISSDALKWSVRPEIGLIKDLESFSGWFTGGLAFILKLNSIKK